ncbi:hypothetical protein WKT22_03585 [Candidatus Lokiarchaeum ossiferum]
MYPNFIFDLTCLIILILFSIGYGVLYSKVKLAEHCSKSLMKQFLIVLLLNICKITIGIFSSNFFSNLTMDEQMIIWTEIVIFSRLGRISYFYKMSSLILDILCTIILVYQIDMKLLYNKTNGKLSKGVIIFFGLKLITLGAVFAVMNNRNIGFFEIILLPILCTIIFLTSKKTPQIKHYSHFLTIGLILYFFNYYAFCPFFPFDMSGFVQKVFSFILYLGIIILGIAFFRTTHFPLINAKFRSIYAVNSPDEQQAKDAKLKPSYNFGAPRTSDFNN